jgi:hypothetical protein
MVDCLSHGELEFPDQPRPGADVHRTRPGARLRDIAASLTGAAVQGQDRANPDQMACDVGE